MRWNLSSPRSTATDDGINTMARPSFTRPVHSTRYSPLRDRPHIVVIALSSPRDRRHAMVTSGCPCAKCGMTSFGQEEGESARMRRCASLGRHPSYSFFPPLSGGAVAKSYLRSTRSAATNSEMTLCTAASSLIVFNTDISDENATGSRPHRWHLRPSSRRHRLRNQQRHFLTGITAHLRRAVRATNTRCKILDR